MVVISRSQGGSYRLAEINGAVSKLTFAAFQLIPYHPHSSTSVEVTQFIDPPETAGTDEE
jgi:hypothetical protein